MNIFESEMFPYLDGEWVKEYSPTFTIASLKYEKIESGGGRIDQKYVLYFVETKKGLVLNKTNAKRIGKLYGGETDNWEGRLIALTTEKVQAFGESHNAIRVVPSVPSVPSVKKESPGIPFDPDEFFQYVNQRVDVPYDNKDDLLATIQIDAPKFKWELLSRGAEKALKIAIDLAMMVEEGEGEQEQEQEPLFDAPESEGDEYYGQ